MKRSLSCSKGGGSLAEVKSVKAARRKGYAHGLTARHHTLIADEPEEAGGSDTGPSPTELLALSLASCTAITVEMYADRKGWDVGAVEAEVDYESRSSVPVRYNVVMRLPGGLSQEQVDKLLVIAGKCPVHRALAGEVEINDRIELSTRSPDAS
jgi:putative redox protein